MTEFWIHLALRWEWTEALLMNTASIVGIIMIVGGALSLMLGGFTTTKRQNIVDVGPLKVEADVEKRHRVPPALSWAVLGGGVVVLVLGLKKK